VQPGAEAQLIFRVYDIVYARVEYQKSSVPLEYANPGGNLHVMEPSVNVISEHCVGTGTHLFIIGSSLRIYKFLAKLLVKLHHLLPSGIELGREKIRKIPLNEAKDEDVA
jgi:hypothetical protein